MKERLKKDLINLMSLPGLSGYEDRVRKYIQNELQRIKVQTPVSYTHLTLPTIYSV